MANQIVVYTQGFMGWGYMRLCCHLVGSRSPIQNCPLIKFFKYYIHLKPSYLFISDGYSFKLKGLYITEVFFILKLFCKKICNRILQDCT